jgi:hypothetical protein
MEQDWDTLIILDACRYDLFTDMADIDGELQKVISAGSHTSEFLTKNFTEPYPDTVYLSATPQIERHDKAHLFHETQHLWKDWWDDDLNTVPPEETAVAALEANSEYPDKRLVVHFIQPHYPFIGSSELDVDHKSVSRDGAGPDASEEDGSVWDLFQEGEIDAETVWSAYRKNLELALPHVEQLVDELDGKTVITSDHGNMFGEFGVYGHPPRLYHEDLVAVPWLEIESHSRRQITEDGMDERTDDDHNEMIESRLRELGYK